MFPSWTTTPLRCLSPRPTNIYTTELNVNRRWKTAKRATWPAASRVAIVFSRVTLATCPYPLMGSRSAYKWQLARLQIRASSLATHLSGKTESVCSNIKVVCPYGVHINSVGSLTPPSIECDVSSPTQVRCKQMWGPGLAHVMYGLPYFANIFFIFGLPVFKTKCVVTTVHSV